MIEKKRKQINALKQEINDVRYRLQTYWNTRGYTDADVLKIGIELTCFSTNTSNWWTKNQKAETK